MAKTANRNKAKTSGPVAGAPGWAWLMTGLAIGLFVAFLVYLSGRPGEQVSLKAPATEDQAADPSAEAGGEKPRFEFYTLLPEMEVVVPETPGKDETLRRETAPQETMEQYGQYVLQAGSFKTFKDADSRKASLALLGVESEIQKVKLDNNETWHRVRIGPYNNLEELNRVRALLHRNDIDTLLVRIRETS